MDTQCNVVNTNHSWHLLHSQIKLNVALTCNGRLETSVRSLHLKLNLALLIFAQVICCPHLIQLDQPLDDATSAFKFTMGNLVDTGDDI